MSRPISMQPQVFYIKPEPPSAAPDPDTIINAIPSLAHRIGEGWHILIGGNPGYPEPIRVALLLPPRWQYVRKNERDAVSMRELGVAVLADPAHWPDPFDPLGRDILTRCDGVIVYAPDGGVWSPPATAPVVTITRSTIERVGEKLTGNCEVGR